MIGIRIGRIPGQTQVHLTAPPTSQRYGRVRPLGPYGNRSGCPADARIVNLPIDDLADCDYENPDSMHSPRGVGVVEDITCFPETPLGICCTPCALQGYRFRDHQSRFVLSWSVLECECYSWSWSGEEGDYRPALSSVRRRKGRSRDE